MENIVHENDTSQETVIRKLYGDKKFNEKKNGTSFKKTFCPGCFYLGNRVTADINYKHAPDICPRSSALVAMIEAEEDAGNNHGENEVCSNEIIHAPQTTATSSFRQVACAKQLGMPSKKTAI